MIGWLGLMIMRGRWSIGRTTLVLALISIAALAATWYAARRPWFFVTLLLVAWGWLMAGIQVVNFLHARRHSDPRPDRRDSARPLAPSAPPLQVGALGYLTKDATRAEIGRAVQAAAAGQAVLDPAVQQRLLSAAARALAAPPDDGSPDLTPREADVLRLIAAGKSNREIARALFVSEATVKTHINRIFAKTGSRDRMQAMRYAYTHGFADPASQATPRPGAPQ
jgi:DNA-binding CsgD family transcriptional regulator